MKNILVLMISLVAFVLCSPIVASAQDVWIFTNEETNETVYVEDESSTWTPRTSQIGSVIIKWVNRDNECTARQMWTFSSDEGYLLANTGNSQAIAIACKEEHAGNAVIHDRPDLFAAYQWLVKRHSNNAPAYAYGKRSGNTESIIEMPGSANDVWAYTDQDGRQYYVRGADYGNLTGFGEDMNIIAYVTVVRPEGDSYSERYVYYHYRSDNSWYPSVFPHPASGFDDPKHPEFYPIFQTARHFL